MAYYLRHIGGMNRARPNTSPFRALGGSGGLHSDLVEEVSNRLDVLARDNGKIG